MFDSLNIAASGLDAAGAFVSAAGYGGTPLLQEVSANASGDGVQVVRIIVDPQPALSDGG